MQFIVLAASLCAKMCYDERPCLSMNEEWIDVNQCLVPSVDSLVLDGDVLVTICRQIMAEHLGLEKDTVHYVGAGEDVTGMLWMSDAVLYSSFRDEQAFPPILSRAMSLQRPVIAPNRSAFREQVRLIGWGLLKCIIGFYEWRLIC